VINSTNMLLGPMRPASLQRQRKPAIPQSFARPYVPPVVSEFACILCLDFCNLSTLKTDAKQSTIGGFLVRSDSSQTQLCVPEGSKVLRTAKSVKRGENPFCINIEIKPSKQISDAADLYHSTSISSDVNQCVVRFNLACRCLQLGKKACECKEIQFSKDGEQVVFGIRWLPEDFIEQAVKIGHPANIFSGLTMEVKQAIETVATWHPSQVVLHRKKWLHRWLQEVPKLEKRDNELKATASPERFSILKPKKIALMQAMLEEEKYPDQDIAADILCGFDLVGGIPNSKVLPKKFSPAVISIQDLEASAKRSREALRLMTKSSGCHDMDCKLWSKTQDELAKGWLVGPIAWSELPNQAVVSRRFPVEQSAKVRPIRLYPKPGQHDHIC